MPPFSGNCGISPYSLTRKFGPSIWRRVAGFASPYAAGKRPCGSGCLDRIASVSTHLACQRAWSSRNQPSYIYRRFFRVLKEFIQSATPSSSHSNCLVPGCCQRGGNRSGQLLAYTLIVAAGKWMASDNCSGPIVFGSISILIGRLHPPEEFTAGSGRQVRPASVNHTCLQYLPLTGGGSSNATPGSISLKAATPT
jgi:hypothetical protein